MQPKLGDRVEVKLKSGESFRGIYLPSPKAVMIKLPNGYNIPFLKKGVKSVKVVGRAKPEKAIVKPKTKSRKPNKPSVAIIHTGGTIASRVDYKTGGVHPLFSTEELLGMFPELNTIASIKSHHLMDVFSEDFDFSHFNKIAQAIKRFSKGTKGVIVTMGTDTMHYTASALSFILSGLNIPVLLVASQRSSDRGSTDSALNVINAAFFITKTDYAGVGICMHATSNDDKCFILKPHNTRKMHTSRRDAFRPVNTLPLAVIDFSEEKIDYISKDYPKQGQGNKLKLMPLNERLRVGLLKYRPHTQPEEFLTYLGFDGMIIEGVGFGNIALTPKIRASIKKLAKTMPVIMTSQCLYGRVNLDVYSRGREELALGILPCSQGMTPETAYIKLAWLLSNFPNKVKELFYKDFRGEHNPRIIKKAFLY